MASSLQKIDPSGTDAEMTARPKVLRRPSQFSTPVNTPAAQPVNLPVPVLQSTEQPAGIRSSPWQEDGRFGLALVLILLVVNLALMLWLPHLRQPPAATDFSALAAPTEQATLTRRTETQPVTLYSQPSRLRLAPSAAALQETPLLPDTGGP